MEGVLQHASYSEECLIAYTECTFYNEQLRFVDTKREFHNTHRPVGYISSALCDGQYPT